MLVVSVMHLLAVLLPVAFCGAGTSLLGRCLGVDKSRDARFEDCGGLCCIFMLCRFLEAHSFSGLWL
jgi:hypothetical protein